MSLPLFAVRPEPGLSETLAAARAAGLAIDGEPLFEIEPVGWNPVVPECIDGVLVGSANAVRHAGRQLKALADIPVHAVGARTAEVARGAGLRVATTGEGGLQMLLDRLGPPLRLLRLAGEKHAPLDPPDGIAIMTRIVYRARPLRMRAAFAERMRRGAAVLLHSGEAAAHFAAECDRLRLAKSRIALVALAPRILERAGHGWATAGAAVRPEEGALLALARDMCQGGAQGPKNGR